MVDLERQAKRIGAESDARESLRVRKFDPRRHPADREFMREFAQEAAADKTGNPVYKAIAEYDKKRYPDLLQIEKSA